MNRNFHHELIPPLLQQVYSVVVGFIARMLVPWLIPRIERPSHWVCRLYYPLSSIRKMSVTYAIVALRNIYKIYLNKTRIGLCYRTTWLSFTDDFYVFVFSKNVILTLKVWCLDFWWRHTESSKFVDIGAWWHQTFTMADFVLQTLRFGGIHPDAIWYEMR